MCIRVYIGVATTDVLIVSLIAIDLEGAVLTGCEAAVVTSPAPSRRAVLRLRPVKYQACSVRVQVHTYTVIVYVYGSYNVYVLLSMILICI